MIVWIPFGHLMTPEQHQTTTGIQRAGSTKCEVTTSIRNQPKQRSENQRIPGSSPLRRPVCGTHIESGGSCFSAYRGGCAVERA
jgi:hypothetical protein